MKPYKIEFTVVAFCEAETLSPERIEKRATESLKRIILDDYDGEEVGRDVFGFIRNVYVTDFTDELATKSAV